MTIFCSRSGSPGIGGLVKIRVRAVVVCRSLQTLGDCDIIEKAQSSGPALSPIGCMKLRQDALLLPWSQSPNLYNEYDNGLHQKFHPLPLNHHFQVCGSFPLTKEAIQETDLCS